MHVWTKQWPPVATLFWAAAALHAVVIALSFNGSAPLYEPQYRILFLVIGWLGIWRTQRWYATSQHYNQHCAAGLCVLHVVIAAFAVIDAVIFVLYAISVY